MSLHPGAEPYSLGPSGAPRVVLFHGLTGVPAELWPLALGLAAVGYRVEAPRWEGHGTSPGDLGRTSADQLIHHARQVATRPDPPVAIVGLSMGALLATIAAAESHSLKALVLMAPAVKLLGTNAIFQQLDRVPGLWRTGLMLPKSRAIPLETAPLPHDEELPPTARIAAKAAMEAEHVLFEGRYLFVPVRWSHELAAIREEARQSAPDVKVPTLLLHGGQDATSSVKSSLEVARWLGSECRFRLFAHSPHVMPLGPERGAIAAEVAQFLERHAPLSRSAIPRDPTRTALAPPA